jgi:tRNA (cmo5U34)-methyltransferase
MSDSHSANFDVRPPVPVHDYLQAAQRINIGYDLIFELVTALLRTHCADDAHVLLVGAGGGTEVRAFGRARAHWRLTGVDPSEKMLTLARAIVDTDDLADRVELIQGTPGDLAPERRFDGATCIFVTMHLPDDGQKRDLLQSIVQHLKPGAPLILVDAVQDNRATFEAAWQQYAEARGMPAEEMAAFRERIKTRSNTITEARTLELLREVGVGAVTRFFTAFQIYGWVAIV